MKRIYLHKILLAEENTQKVKPRIIQSQSKNRVIQEVFQSLLSQSLKPVKLQRSHQMVRNQRWMKVQDILVSLL